MKRILPLILLFSGALNAMQITRCDLGSEKTYKELQVWSELWQEPYGSEIGRVSKMACTRRYTNSNARLHCVPEHDAGTITAGNHAAYVKLYAGELLENSTQVAVDYELMQLPMLSWIFNPTKIESEEVFLTIGGEKQTVEHKTSKNEKVTLVLAAKWQAYMVAKDGRHVKVESAQANAATNDDNDNTNNV